LVWYCVCGVIKPPILEPSPKKMDEANDSDASASDENLRLAYAAGQKLLGDIQQSGGGTGAKGLDKGAILRAVAKGLDEGLEVQDGHSSVSSGLDRFVGKVKPPDASEWMRPESERPGFLGGCGGKPAGFELAGASSDSAPPPASDAPPPALAKHLMKTEKPSETDRLTGNRICGHSLPPREPWTAPCRGRGTGKTHKDENVSGPVVDFRGNPFDVKGKAKDVYVILIRPADRESMSAPSIS
jgi:hypothetical protein